MERIPGRLWISGRGLVRANLCLVFFMAVLMAGCGLKTKAPEAAQKADYPGVLERWSRGVKIFDGLESRLYFNATYKTPDFRRAYIDRYSKSYELGEDSRKNLLDRELEQAEAYNEFFFTAYTPDEGWNDFEEKGSIWKLYLEDGSGNRVVPVSVTKLDNSDPVIREFFPYFDLWSSAYTVKFPKYSETGKEIPGADESVKLIVTGVKGKGELEWRLK